MPSTIGETKPPNWPAMFIVPPSVAVARPPMSMQVVHEPGIVRSIAKLTSAMSATAT